MSSSDSVLTSPGSASPRPGVTPGFFGTGEKMFGWYHAAGAGGARRCGVLICASLGHEATYVHRSMRLLAEQLAAAGFPTVRFDYLGTGDSSGSDLDED